MALFCDAILFDLDGVLIDSDAVIRRRWKRWADDRGIPFEEVEAVNTGRPAVEVIEEVAPHLDPETEIERLGDEMATDAADLEAFDGAKALLGRLPRGRWAIATSGRHRTATSRMAHVGLPEPEVLVTADDVERGKPAPEPYRRAADQLGIDPGRCVVFEDAPAGVESARRAGASVVGVATSAAPDALVAATAVVPQLNAVEIHPEGEGLRVDWPRGDARLESES
ncbi:MAG: HAD family hydrolase [Salinibacter sp.]|jgi:haloacid dehalogenase superfamily, subfamily IA, variant 3 with third motif having DD or ED/haloacid dehalogenase superfamily, subfamily IA, variant 1 with third motif having Dx(3-4)D or Dx(3-4)E|uniref:HAD family hydrolase n=1 Tax=Salinibacter sp. TaxID=2065818 RepID=UPI002FC31B70